MNETINKRVARCRKMAGLTQIQAAEKMNMKCSTYSQMERHGNISAERLSRLAQIFGVDSAYLLGATEQLTTIISPKKETTENVLKQETFFNKRDFSTVFVATKKEENIIKILRNLPKNVKNEVVEYIEQRYKETKEQK